MKNGMDMLRAQCTPPRMLVILIVLLMITAFGGMSGSKDSMTQLEMRIGETLSQLEGVEGVRVVIRTRKMAVQSKALGIAAQGDEIPCGVVVAAQGADDPVVKLKLIRALCALLGLQASEVEVIGIEPVRR